MKCPRKECNNEARIHPLYGVIPCLKCQGEDPKVKVTSGDTLPTSRLHRVQEQRDRSAKDMLQPFDNGKPNPEFIKAYPDLAPNYFTKEELKESV